jgi:choice-of-anchor C domain-containing protein
MFAAFRRVRLLGSLTVGLVLTGTTIVGMTPASATGSKASTNLILNHSFEKPICITGVGICDYTAGSRVMPHWTVGGHSVDLVAASYWKPAGGNQSLDLAGTAPGSVTQKVATTAGITYILSWYMAGNPDGAPMVKIMNVYWNGALVHSYRFNTTGHTLGSMGWVRRQVTVTATRSTSILKFADARTHGDSPYGPTLDLVSLVPAG